MKQSTADRIVQGMLPFLNNEQLRQLQRVLERTLCEDESMEKCHDNTELMEAFLR